MSEEQKALVVEVTDTDIAEGQTMNGRNCPIARAIKRATGVEDVKIGKWSWSVGEVDGKLPNTAVRFIMDFDMHRSVQPFKFALAYKKPD